MQSQERLQTIGLLSTKKLIKKNCLPVKDWQADFIDRLFHY